MGNCLHTPLTQSRKKFWAVEKRGLGINIIFIDATKIITYGMGIFFIP